jgi:dethiobiotin synthetase
MSRPRLVVVIVGTDTEVGKTWVACRLLENLRSHGVQVAARKPAQSFDPADDTTDADLLAAASGEQPAAVCPEHHWYPIAMAPPMAAAALGRPAFSIHDLAAELSWSDATAVGLVETAGGVRSPLAHDGDSVGLIGLVRPDVVVVVADPELGTINRVRLTVDAVEAVPGNTSIAVFLNRFDPQQDLHQRNQRWLHEHDGFTVLTSVTELSMYVRRPVVGSSRS